VSGEDYRKKYRVFLKGQNFWMDFEGKLQKTGFYTTRFVEAQNPKEAEDLVIELIKKDANLLASVRNENSNPPMLYVEEIEEVDMLQPKLGYIFFPDEEMVH
jgi:hypothetical protein